MNQGGQLKPEYRQRLIDSGVPLKGCFAWSLLDNFEWPKAMGSASELYIRTMKHWNAARKTVIILFRRLFRRAGSKYK
jgi:beta-glucosidase/6-phospho-beta-glucosidase/beta-galactosidase